MGSETKPHDLLNWCKSKQAADKSNHTYATGTIFHYNKTQDSLILNRHRLKAALPSAADQKQKKT